MMATRLARGACFGYEPTGLALQQLRPGTGAALSVAECAPQDVPAVPPDAHPISVWRPRPDNPFSARLVRQDGIFLFSVDGMGVYVIDPAAATIGVPPDVDPYRREARMWGVPAVLCFDRRGDVPLHAAAVDVNGAAVLLVGPSHHGKSTLAAACVAGGHRLLAEDTTCVGLEPAPFVLPGPPTLRLRPDVFAALEVPGARAVRRDADRVHLLLDENSRGSATAVPLAGVVFLHVGADDDIRVEPVESRAALSNLWVTSYNIPDDEHRGVRFAQLALMAAVTPIWNLTRPLVFPRLPDVVAVIEKIASG